MNFISIYLAGSSRSVIIIISESRTFVKPSDVLTMSYIYAPFVFPFKIIISLYSEVHKCSFDSVVLQCYSGMLIAIFAMLISCFYMAS